MPRACERVHRTAMVQPRASVEQLARQTIPEACAKPRNGHRTGNGAWVDRTGRTSGAPRSKSRPCFLGFDACPVDGCARLDHRRHCAADHCRRPRRIESHLVGNHRIPPRSDGGHTALRQAGGPVRAPHRAAGRPGDLPDRLRPLRHQPHVPGVDRLPSSPGFGRWRPSGQRASGGWGCGSTPPARSLPRIVRCGLRSGHSDWSTARGRTDDQPLVAVDLLHQYSHRCVGLGCPRRDVPESGRSHAPPHRLPGVGAAGPGSRSRGADGEPRWHHLPVGFDASRGSRGHHPDCSWWLRGGRTPSRRASTPVAICSGIRSSSPPASSPRCSGSPCSEPSPSFPSISKSSRAPRPPRPGWISCLSWADC